MRIRGPLVLAAVPAIMGAGLIAGGLPHEEYGAAVASLVRLTKERLRLGEKVAAAKWRTGQPIEDPQREARVLREVAELSAEIGLDPAIGTCYFQTQIEASKRLQRRLHALWRERPESRPARRPDLATEVRPQMDRLTVEILHRLKLIDSAPPA